MLNCKEECNPEEIKKSSCVQREKNQFAFSLRFFGRLSFSEKVAISELDDVGVSFTLYRLVD